MYTRTINLPNLLSKKSFFLFGPRSTGKSTLIQQQLKSAKTYDLLHGPTFSRLLRDPTLIEQEAIDPTRVVAIDEVQKLPQILDEVHRCIEKHKMRFLLTGSSARKLKPGAANLLAGRAWSASLLPLTSQEIPSFNLIQYLNRGGLPHIYQSLDYQEELESYVSLYLREEIQAESFTRNISAFTQLLDLIALSNGEEINFESFARECGVSPKAIHNYFEILEDTLLGYQLHAFVKTKKRKAISRSKFYLFDLGVTNVLARRSQIREKSELYGKALEHFIVNEVRAYLSYRRCQKELTYWRSTSQFEVDLIIGDDLAIEVKATSQVLDKHLTGLRALKEEGMLRRYLVVSHDVSMRRTVDGIEVFPFEKFIEQLWSDQLFELGA